MSPPPRPTSDQLRGLAYGVVGMVIFGLTLPAAKAAVEEFSPVIVGIGRTVIAAAVAAVILLVVRAPLPERRHWPALIGTAAGVVVGFPLLSAIAVQYAPAGHAGVVLGLLPLATAVAAATLAGERPSWLFWLTAVLGAGLVTAFSLRGGDQELRFADLLLAAATASAAFGYALGGKLSRHMGGWKVICWALIFALPLTLPVTLAVLPNVNWQAGPAAWSGLLYVALFSQLIGFFAWNRGLALGGIARVGQVQLLQTFITLIAAALLLSERIDAATIGFAAAVVVVVAIGQRARVHSPPG